MPERLDVRRLRGAGSYRRDGLMARFGLDIALPDFADGAGPSASAGGTSLATKAPTEHPNADCG